MLIQRNSFINPILEEFINSMPITERGKLREGAIRNKDIIRHTIITGDAWVCELNSYHPYTNKSVLILRDYDENESLEAEIAIDFTKEELHTFIEHLQDIENAMK